METESQPLPNSNKATVEAPAKMAPVAKVATSAGIFLVEERLIEEAKGESELVDLGPLAGKGLGVILGIQSTVEQQSLELTVWGSADGENWEADPLLHFPQKFYVGVSELFLDLTANASIRYLKAKWAANRWGRGSTTPAFRAYVFLRSA